MIDKHQRRQNNAHIIIKSRLFICELAKHKPDKRVCILFGNPIIPIYSHNVTFIMKGNWSCCNRNTNPHNSHLHESHPRIAQSPSALHDSSAHPFYQLESTLILLAINWTMFNDLSVLFLIHAHTIDPRVAARWHCICLPIMRPDRIAFLVTSTMSTPSTPSLPLNHFHPHTYKTAPPFAIYSYCHTELYYPTLCLFQHLPPIVGCTKTA